MTFNYRSVKTLSYTLRSCITACENWEPAKNVEVCPLSAMQTPVEVGAVGVFSFML